MISKNGDVAILRLIENGVLCIHTVYIVSCHSSLGAFASQVASGCIGSQPASIETVQLQVTFFAAKLTPQAAAGSSQKAMMMMIRPRIKGFLNDVKLWFSVACKFEIMTEALSLAVHFSFDCLRV